MPYVFETFREVTDPKTGKRVPLRDAKGRKVPHARKRFEYRDWQGQRREMTGYPGWKETADLAARVQAQQDEIRKGIRPAPQSCDEHVADAFADVVAEYRAWGEAQGGRKGHPWGDGTARKHRTNLDWWAERLGLKTLGDLEGILPRAEKALRERAEKGLFGKGKLRLAGKTLANIAESLHAFGAWAVGRGYLRTNPLEGMAGFDLTPRTTRRAMTPAEIAGLLEAAPPHRRLLYETALTSGLRANELRQLERKHLDLDRGGLVLEARWTKNRMPGFQPIPAALLERLRAFGASQGAARLYAELGPKPRKRRMKVPADPLLYIGHEPARDMRRDMGKAGILRRTGLGILDFHALRVTYDCLALEAGAGVKEAMELMRHSTPHLTLNVYARARGERLSAIAESIGAAVLPSGYGTGPERIAVGAESLGTVNPSGMRTGGVERNSLQSQGDTTLGREATKSGQNPPQSGRAHEDACGAAVKQRTKEDPAATNPGQSGYGTGPEPDTGPPDLASAVDARADLPPAVRELVRELLKPGAGIPADLAAGMTATVRALRAVREGGSRGR